MIHRPRFHPPPHIYPPDEWNLIQKRFMADLLEQDETMFALGNGYLGMRGCFERRPLTWEVFVTPDTIGRAKVPSKMRYTCLLHLH
jgi:hypothetical protein